MPADLTWSPASEEDLNDIWRYFARIASVGVADTLIRGIKAASRRIAQNPQSWQERPEFMGGIRGFPVHPCIIFYRVQKDGPEIVRVLHERRHAARIRSAEDRERYE